MINYGSSYNDAVHRWTEKKVHPFHIFKYVFLILASIISIFPFLWMIICATNDAVDINRGTVTFGTSLFKNLQNLFAADHGFLKALGNSAIIAVITTVLALLVSSAAGYGFEMFRTKIGTESLISCSSR